MFHDLLNLPHRLLSRVQRRNARRRATADMLSLGERLLRDIGTTPVEVVQRGR